jgi:hypothetical protein
MIDGDAATKTNTEIRCRVAACPEVLGDGKEWSFYLINDGNAPLDRALLKAFGREWGDFGDATHPNVEFTNIEPAKSVLIWRDDDEELRMWLSLHVRMQAREASLLFEFPLLYRRKADLPLVAGLGKPGCVVSPVES